MKGGEIGIGGRQTAIVINLNINEVLQKKDKQTDTAESVAEDSRKQQEARHVVLNLDAVIMNPRKSSNSIDSKRKIKIPKDTGFEIFANCRTLFLTKSGEPWHQNYFVRTSSDQIAFVGNSEEICCCNMDWKEKHVYLLNNSGRELLKIRFRPAEYLVHSNERSFTIFSSSDKVRDMDTEMTDLTRKLELGIVKLSHVHGICFIASIANITEQIHFTGVATKDTVKILSHEHSIPVAFIDLRKSNLLNWVDSYMITFTKEISITSKTLILTAAMCYDIGFCRRTESIKSVLTYVLYLGILLAAAIFFFVFLRNLSSFPTSAKPNSRHVILLIGSYQFIVLLHVFDGYSLVQGVEVLK